MSDVAARVLASGLAIAVGVVASTRLTEAAAHRRSELVASDVTSAIDPRALSAIGAPPRLVLSTRSDSDAIHAMCTGAGSTALLGRAATPAEVEDCGTAGVRLDQRPVAFAFAAVAVPVGNTFVDALSVDQLRMIFGRTTGEPLTFRDLDPRWPNVDVVAVGVEAATPARAILERRLGAAKVTFDGRSSASDVAAAIEGDDASIGFFGPTQPGALAHAIRLVPIRGGDGVARYPTREALDADAYPLGVTIWLASDAPADGERARIAAPVNDDIAAAASAADCLVLARRMRVARR